MLSLERKGDRLVAYISGELDHHKCAIIRKKIDTVVQQERPNILELDYSQVQFMDSSGIGLVMGRYKQLTMMGGKLIVTNIPSHLLGIFRLSGLGSLGVLR
ncbi:MAG: anti-sigma factor antagonist [Ruminococcus sp.]